ncbi:MAG: YdcH family protein [Kordiimonadaceae bacterium]|nr:YdcH family protein [Kordiimonadaceae bacterium]MBO6567166.1 YdcH family protein [Kordiimonadaceae bacterium]MBO6963619.1 YdcH family protein [Kordiimonadaceae bacterium]
MADDYHTINREIHRIEIGDEHVSQFAEEDLRKRRMLLKDEIYSLLKSQATH